MDAATTIPASLANAVDAMVDQRGVTGAERELQQRFGPDSKRELAALAYLRREYE